MIIGPKNWNTDYYIQDNNATEHILKVITRAISKKFKIGFIGWLETCGPTAAVNCLGALGYDMTIKIPGLYKQQAEDLLTNCMNDPREPYKSAFETVRKIYDIPGNRVPQFYPLAVDFCFRAKGEFKFLHNFRSIKQYISKGRTIQLCMKNPGHYIAALAYDTSTNEIIYNDPWAGHSRNKKGGHGERLTEAEYNTNILNYIVIYSK